MLEMPGSIPGAASGHGVLRLREIVRREKPCFAQDDKQGRMALDKSEGIPRLAFCGHGYGQVSLARAVEFDQNDSLPGAQDQLAMLEWERYRCSDQGGEDVIGDVGRVVGMAVAKLRNHGFEGIEHVEIGAGIEVGCGQRGRGVEDEQVADSRRLRVVFLEQGFDRVGDVQDFAFLAGFDGDLLHGWVTLFEALNSLRKDIEISGWSLEGAALTACVKTDLSPRWGLWTSHFLPTACALGCILAPLRG